MANACITSYMSGYQDPRREKYFLPSAYDGSYMGVRSGIAGMNKSNYVEYSHMIYSEEANKTAPMPVMLASEAAFLRAEGALKGWNMGGDAKSFYEQGIRLSFDQWGLPELPTISRTRPAFLGITLIPRLLQTILPTSAR